MSQSQLQYSPASPHPHDNWSIEHFRHHQDLQLLSTLKLQKTIGQSIHNMVSFAVVGLFGDPIILCADSFICAFSSCHTLVSAYLISSQDIGPSLCNQFATADALLTTVKAKSRCYTDHTVVAPCALLYAS